MTRGEVMAFAMGAQQGIALCDLLGAERARLLLDELAEGCGFEVPPPGDFAALALPDGP